jgi:hypothetical protein
MSTIQTLVDPFSVTGTIGKEPEIEIMGVRVTGLRSARCVLAICGAATAALLAGPSVPASADCGTEQGVFWSDYIASLDHFRGNAHGTTGFFQLRDRDINHSCGTGVDLAGSTSQVANNLAEEVEFGWRERVDPTDLNGEVFDGFVEWSTVGAGIFHPVNFPCTVHLGDSPAWRVANSLGTNNWSFKLACDGSTYHDVTWAGAATTSPWDSRAGFR